MPRAFPADRIVVTEAMITTYGPFIWQHSNNIQTRQGDAVRLLDFSLARKSRGMTDQEMAETLGLQREEVLQIRVMLEARNYNRHRYSRLYELGGNRRFRGEIEAPDTRARDRSESGRPTEPGNGKPHRGRS